MNDVLVLSGGATRGAALLGALNYLESKEILQKYKTIVGTSVGSIIAVLLACGICPSDIFQNAVVVNNMFNFKFDIPGFIRGKGIYEIEKLIAPLEDIIVAKMGKVPTLKYLYDHHGYDLRIAVCNLSHGTIEFFSHLTTPKLKCTDALKVSCSIPFIFKKCIYNGSCYIDAGIYNNLPLDGCPSNTTSILALDVSIYSRDNCDNFMNTFNSLISLPPHMNKMKLLTEYQSKYGDALTYVPIHCNTGKIFDLASTTSNLTQMYQIGEETLAKAFSREAKEARNDDNATVIVDQSEE